MSDLISKQLLDLWNKYKPTIAVDAIEYDRELRQLLSTNLAEVGTGCSEFPNNSDTISRQAAIDDIWTVSPLARLDRKWIDRWLRQLPPIQPKKGRWIGKYPVTSVCSECGFLIHDSKVKVFAFCPNCGADMRQREE